MLKDNKAKLGQNCPTVLPDKDTKMKEHSNQIFKNIFAEVFLSNCGNPIDFDQVRWAI